MSFFADRVAKQLSNYGQPISIEDVETIAILKTMNTSEVLTYETSGAAASWERPVWKAICLPSVNVVRKNSVITADFEGKVRKVIPTRLRDELIAKVVIITEEPNGTGPISPDQP